MTAILHGGDVWRGAEPEEYLDFSANLNPDGPPDWVREAMAAGLRRVGYYPDMRLTGARRGLAAVQAASVVPECRDLRRKPGHLHTCSAGGWRR